MRTTLQEMTPTLGRFASSFGQGLVRYATTVAAVFPVFLGLLFSLQLGRSFQREPTHAGFYFITAVAAITSLVGLWVLFRQGRYRSLVLFFALFLATVYASTMPIWFGRPWLEGRPLWQPSPRRGMILDGPVYAEWDVWVYVPLTAIFISWILIRWRKNAAIAAVPIALLSAAIVFRRFVEAIEADYDFSYGPSQIRLISLAAVAPFLFGVTFYFVSHRAERRSPPAKDRRVFTKRLVVGLGVLVAGYAAPITFAPSAIEKEEFEASVRATRYYDALELELRAKALRSGIHYPRERRDGSWRIGVTRCRCYLPLIVKVSMQGQSEGKTYPEYEAAYLWLPLGVVRLYKSHPF